MKTEPIVLEDKESVIFNKALDKGATVEEAFEVIRLRRLDKRYLFCPQCQRIKIANHHNSQYCRDCLLQRQREKEELRKTVYKHLLNIKPNPYREEVYVWCELIQDIRKLISCLCEQPCKAWVKVSQHNEKVRERKRRRDAECKGTNSSS